MRVPIARLSRIAACLAVAGLGRPDCVGAQTLSRDVREGIMASVVEIRPWDVEARSLANQAGSGTIISPDGYILTNFHVIGDLEARTYHQEHAIYMTRAGFFDQPPRHMYWATHIASDPTHDLALLKIHQYPDESPVDASLVLPFVTVGDSNDLLPGDPIGIVGYPGISGRTITYTAGSMSGWVGEDMESGGKQWIKTDAKIAHGNSGGAAVNDRGELVGVPTAGRVVEYEELDVEEQAYVRPIGLAWALIGPNVASVRTAEGARPPSGEGDGDRAEDPPGAEGQPSGTYGEVAIGATRRAIIAGSSGPIVFNTYTTMVPPGLESLTIRVDGGDDDIDLAVKVGSEIRSYSPSDEGGDYDALDMSAATTASHTYTEPDSGVVYIDVLNTLEHPVSYELTLEAVGDTEPPDADPTASGLKGPIALPDSITAELAGIEGAAGYHTYVVDVPAGTETLTITLDGDRDFDIAAKHGSTILSYADQANGGDWDYRDNTVGEDAEIVVTAPAEGRWYIDVYDGWLTADVGSYVLIVR